MVIRSTAAQVALANTPGRPILVLLTALIVFSANSVVGAETVGQLVGVAVDRRGRPIAGVSIRLRSEVLIGGPQHATTGGEGSFAFRLLPPGSYTVEAEHRDFAPSQADIQVHPGRSSDVRLELPKRRFTHQIEVAAQPPRIDITRVDAGETWGREILEQASLGIAGRTLLGVVSKEAGVAGGPRPSIMGSTPSENSFLIDGLTINDPVSGAAALQLNFDALQEVAVHTSGFEAQYGQALGGVINAVTKSGGNMLSGSLDLRYRDQNLADSGDFFDPERDPNSLAVGSVTLGGPILRDHIWYFSSIAVNRESTTAFLSPLTSTATGVDWIGKITWQLGAGHRLVAKAAGDRLEVENEDANRFVGADAGRRRERGNTIYQLAFDAVISDSLTFDLRIGVNQSNLDVEPMNGQTEVPAIHNYDTGIVSGSSGFIYRLPTNSEQVVSSITWLNNGGLGSHAVRAGLEMRRVETDVVGFATGDVSLAVAVYDPDGTAGGSGRYDSDGDGLSDVFLMPWDPLSRIPIHSDGASWTVYLQDEWRPTGSVTVKAGMRYDSVAYVNDEERSIADLNLVQPRLGIAWDVSGNGRHVLRLNIGRFMHPATVNIANLASGRDSGFGNYFAYDFYCGVRGMCDPDYLAQLYGEPLVWTDPEGDEHLFYLWSDTWIEPFQSIESLGLGSLAAPRADQFMVSSEHRLWNESTLELMYVHKQTRNLLEDTCRNNSWILGDGVPPDIDQRDTYTDVSGCTGYVLTNAPMLERDYRAAIAKFKARGRGFGIYANYSYSVSQGSTEATADEAFVTEEFDVFPRDFYNTYGYLSDDRRHRVKVYGYLQLPHGFNVGFDAWWSSAPALDRTVGCNELAGTPHDRLDALGIDHDLWSYCSGSFSGDLYLEPRGSRRGESSHQLDLELSKRFAVGQATVTGIITVINALSNEGTIAYQTAELGGSPWGTALAYQQPRRYELGIRVTF